jgi:hypothetical protein
MSLGHLIEPLFQKKCEHIWQLLDHRPAEPRIVRPRRRIARPLENDRRRSLSSRSHWCRHGRFQSRAYPKHL